MFKIIVAGTRTFTDYELMKAKLDFYLQGKEMVTIIHGGAEGADKLAIRYAQENNYIIEGVNAEWDLHGKAAGPRRNERMAERANACVVFWDGKSPGSANMIGTAKKMGLPLRIVRYTD